jgi:aminopeptidase N
LLSPAPPDFGGPLSIGDSYLPELGSQSYDVQQYTLRFELDPAVRFVRGHATIQLVAQATDVEQLVFDFIGYDISHVAVNSRPVPYTRTSKKLLVTMPAPVQPGANVTVDIHYEGEPPQFQSRYMPALTHLGFQYKPDGSLYTFSEPDGARAWFPANDHPRDKAAFRFEITVPAGLTAVANGHLLANEVVGEGSRFTWEHLFPMAPYLAVVAVDDYVLVEQDAVEGIVLRSYVEPEHLDEFREDMDVNPQAMRWMNELFGPYPFDVYGYVTVDLPELSMETQTMTLLSDSLIGRRTMVHELSHAWFGNWVSLDSWGDMWRNEGFATYINLMWVYRDNPAGLEAEMANIAATLQADGDPHPLQDPPPAELLGYDTYMKGALLVHTLRREIGDDAFFAGLMNYVSEFGGGTASHADFQQALEAEAGRSLDAFFETWLE